MRAAPASFATPTSSSSGRRSRCRSSGRRRPILIADDVGLPLGSIAGGVLGNRIGLQPAIWVGALVWLLGFVPVTVSSVRSIRRMPAHAAEASSPEAPEAVVPRARADA